MSSPFSLRMPPHSLEAEQSVIGGLLLSGEAYEKVSDRLSEKDFYKSEHKLVFAAIKKLSNEQKPVDILTVTDALKASNDLDSVGEPYLLDLMARVPSIHNIVAYANMVRQRSIKRQVINSISDITDKAYKDELSAEELLKAYETSASSISDAGFNAADPDPIKKVMQAAFERLSSPQLKDNYLRTGFKDLDNLISGFQKGDLIILAARPSMGKTTLALNFAENNALSENKPTLIFSLEMSKEQLALRFISSLGRVNQQKLRRVNLSQGEWISVGNAIAAFSKANMHIDDTPALTPSDIRTRARRMARNLQSNLGLIVIDYLQLIHDPAYKNNRTQEIGAITRKLKALARELNVPVLVLSQLNRALESRGDKRPGMSDLRDSGEIEQDADLIAFIYRDEVYNEQSAAKGIAEVIISKQRNGPVGRVNLKFFGEFTRFENICL